MIPPQRRGCPGLIVLACSHRTAAISSALGPPILMEQKPSLQAIDVTGEPNLTVAYEENDSFYLYGKVENQFLRIEDTPAKVVMAGEIRPEFHLGGSLKSSAPFSGW